MGPASAGGSCTFSNWSSTDSDVPVQFTPVSGNQSFTAVYDCNNGGVSTITVYAHRVPASYWSPCFATVCAAGTGPRATMYFASTAREACLIRDGFSNEDGYTFPGLTSGATYILRADDCDSCHGSTHDVIFDHWGDGNADRPYPGRCREQPRRVVHVHQRVLLGLGGARSLDRLVKLVPESKGGDPRQVL